jgi:hypothetical protein
MGRSYPSTSTVHIQTHCNILECFAVRSVVVMLVVVVYIETCRPNSILFHSGPIHALRRSSYVICSALSVSIDFSKLAHTVKFVKNLCYLDVVPYSAIDI